MKTLRLLAVAVILLAACTTSSSGSTASPIAATSPTPSLKPADSKASDLRTRLNLLLGEQLVMVAKQAVAASNHTDEYTGYATLLTANATSMVGVMRSAFGNSTASQFEQAWSIQNDYLVDYTIGLVTHNENKSNAAMSGLVNGFVPQFAQLVTSVTQLPIDPVIQLETQQVTDAKTMIDDEVAQSYSKMYADLRVAYAHSSRVGDLLATRMAQKFPDKFPGDTSGKAVDVRVSLNNLLQEHSYLATMASEAVIGGRAAEGAAALGALAANRGELAAVLSGLLGAAVATRLEQLWGTRDADLVAYASSGDAGTRQRLAGSFVSQFSGLAPAPAETVRAQLVATIKVIDDQRARALQQVAGDDRAAAAAMQAIADRID